MKRVLLTGGAGSIGIHVIGHIMHNTDWEVVCLDSFRHKGYRDRLTQTFKDHPDWAKRVKEVQTDLVCPISLETANEIGQIDHILHLAALSDVFFGVENPVYVLDNNIRSTINMLEYARRIDIESFVYFSTDEVYGPVRKGTSHKEWDTHLPSNAYSASKAASEDIAYMYWRSYGVPVIITNTMNNFSMMQSSAKFPVIVQKALEKDEIITIHGNKKEIGTRFYIDSRVVAEALLWILDKGAYQHKIGEIDKPLRYHIVGDNCWSNLELVEKIAKIMNKKAKYKLEDFHKDNPAHDIHYGLEDNNLRPNGWKPSKSTEQCLSEVIDWQSKNREWLE